MFITPHDHECATCGHVFKFSESFIEDGSRWPVTFVGTEPVCPRCWDDLLRRTGIGKPVRLTQQEKITPDSK